MGIVATGAYAGGTNLWGEHPCTKAQDLGLAAFKFAGDDYWMMTYHHVGATVLGTCRDTIVIEIVTPGSTAVFQAQLSAGHAAGAGGPYHRLVFDAILSEGWRRCSITSDGLVDCSTWPSSRQDGDWKLHHLPQLDRPTDSAPRCFAIPIKTGRDSRHDWSWHWALRRGAADKRTKYLVIETNLADDDVWGYMLQEVL